MTSISTMKELKTRLSQNNPQDIILDVRTNLEYKSGHIPNAININVVNLNFVKEVEKLGKDKNFILYCHSGSRSYMASLILQQKGFKVTNVKQGYPAWQNKA